MKHHFDGLCPRCRQREKQPDWAYCKECQREVHAAYRERERNKTTPEFRALLLEARECRESVKYLRKMGEIGRARE